MKIKHIILFLVAMLPLGFLSVSYSNTSDKGVKEFESGNNFYNKGDYKKAFYWYGKSAEQKNANAQMKLATMYRDGKGISVDGEKMEHWLRESAKNGEPRAQKIIFQLDNNRLVSSILSEFPEKEGFYNTREGRIKLRDRLLSKILPDSHCEDRKLKLSLYKMRWNDVKEFGFACMDVFIPENTLGIVTIHGINKKSNYDVKIYNWETKKQVKVSDNKGYKEITTFGDIINPGRYQVIFYDTSGNRG